MMEALSFALTLAGRRVSVEHIRGLRCDEGGLIGIIGAIAVGFLAIFGVSAAAQIDWKWMISALMMIAVVVAVVGVVILKQDPSLILITIFACMGVAFMLEVSLPMIIALAIFVGIFWRLKFLKAQPLMVFTLIVVGLAAMVLGSYMVLEPAGIVP